MHLQNRIEEGERRLPGILEDHHPARLCRDPFVGIVALAWPGIGLATLIALFAAALLSGITSIIGAFQGPVARERRAWLLLDGAIAIGAGLLVSSPPGLSARALLLRHRIDGRRVRRVRVRARHRRTAYPWQPVAAADAVGHRVGRVRRRHVRAPRRRRRRAGVPGRGLRDRDGRDADRLRARAAPRDSGHGGRSAPAALHRVHPACGAGLNPNDLRTGDTMSMQIDTTRTTTWWNSIPPSPRSTRGPARMGPAPGTRRLHAVRGLLHRRRRPPCDRTDDRRGERRHGKPEARPPPALGRLLRHRRPPVRPIHVDRRHRVGPRRAARRRPAGGRGHERAARVRRRDQPGRRRAQIEATTTVDHHLFGMAHSPLGMLRPAIALHVRARLHPTSDTATEARS